MRKKNLTEKEVIELIRPMVKQKFIGAKNYKIFHMYLSRYDKGELNETAKKKLFEFFGYTSECVYQYNPDNDNSIAKGE